MSKLDLKTTTPATMTTPSSMHKFPFKILEVKVISAHDLPPVSKRLNTYVVAWADPDHKEITPVDHKGNTNPMWNHRMVFGVDDKFLASGASAVMMEIYNVSRLSKKPIGTTWLPIEILLKNPHSEIMKKPLTLQICRPTGDIKGHLVVTVNLVNTTIRNRIEDDENYPQQMTYLGDEDDDVNTFSDPERVSLDSEMKALPLDVAFAVRNGIVCSPVEGNPGVGTSMFNEWIDGGGDYSNNKEPRIPTRNVVKRKSKESMLKKGFRMALYSVRHKAGIGKVGKGGMGKANPLVGLIKS